MDQYFHITEKAFKSYISCYGHYTPNPEQLIQGLFFDNCGSNSVLTQYNVYKDNELVGYVRLRGGDLSASFPNHLAVDAYYHKFEDEHKGDFASKKEERIYLNEIAEALNKCIEEYTRVVYALAKSIEGNKQYVYSEDKEQKWNYFSSLIGKDSAALKENIKDTDYFNLSDFRLFIWLFGCEETVKTFGIEKIKYYFEKGIRQANSIMSIENDFFIEDLPSHKSKEEYYWLRKTIHEHPDADENEILKLYHHPIDEEKIFNKKFSNRQCLPCFGSGGGLLYPLPFSDIRYGTMAFQAGINETGKGEDIIVYVNGEETQEKCFKDAVLKGLNNYHKANWICVVSLILRTAAFNINGTYNRETRDYDITANVKEECLKAITRDINEVAEECAWWEWED